MQPTNTKATAGLFISFIMIVAFTGCKKDKPTNHTIINGTLVEYGSNKPLPNKKAYLASEKNDFNFGSGPSAYTTIKDFTTDANGNFSYQFDADPNYSYVIFSINQLPYSNSDTYSLTKGTINNITMPLTPPAWLKLHVKNISGSDQIGFNGFAGGSFSYYGYNVDTTSVFQVPGNRNNIIAWGVVKNGNLTNYNKTIYCLGFDTTFYEILY